MSINAFNLNKNLFILKTAKLDHVKQKDCFNFFQQSFFRMLADTLNPWQSGESKMCGFSRPEFLLRLCHWRIQPNCDMSIYAEKRSDVSNLSDNNKEETVRQRCA